MAHSVALAYVGFGKQTTPGTAVAPTDFLRWTTLSAEDTLKMGTYRGGFTRDFEVALKEAQWQDGKMVGWLYPLSGAKLLAYFLGGADVVTGGSDPYTHTFHEASACTNLPGISFEHSMGCGLEIDRVADCIVDQLTLTAKAGGLVTLGVDWRGAKNTAQASAATVSYETSRPASFADATLTFTGLDVAAVDVTELTIMMKNSSEQVYTLGQVYPRVIQPTGREFDVTFNVYVPDNKLYREVFFGAAGNTTGSPITSYLTSLEAVFDVSDGGANRSIDITIANIELDAAKPLYSADAKAFMVQAHGKAISTGANQLCTVIAKNAASGAFVS